MKIKTTLAAIANSLYGFLSFYILPTALLYAFNRAKGDVNNPDGRLFVPLGWLMLILIPVFYVIFNYVALKKLSLSKKALIICVSAAVVGAAVAIVLVNNSYSDNYTNILKLLS